MVESLSGSRSARPGSGAGEGVGEVEANVKDGGGEGEAKVEGGEEEGAAAEGVNESRAVRKRPRGLA